MKLKLNYTNDIEDYSELLFHAMFQVLVDYVNNVKGSYRPDIKFVKKWEYGMLPAPHVFEFSYADASWASKFFFRKRWDKHLAMSYIHQQITELSGPSATVPEVEYSIHLQTLMDLYLWYTTEYKSLSRKESIEIQDQKLQELMGIRLLFWDD